MKKLMSATIVSLCILTLYHFSEINVDIFLTLFLSDRIKLGYFGKGSLAMAGR
jgi:hypothetical protein